MATTKKNNTKKGCPVGQAWDISLGRCVDIDDDTQNLFGYSLKGGVNWFGEDSPSDTMFSGTKNYKKEREEAVKKAAAAKAAVAKKTPPKKVGGSIGTKMKTGGIKKMKKGGAKKYGEGGPTNKTNSTPTESKSQPNTPPTGNPRLKNGGAKKSVLKKAMYGTTMMKKGGATKKK